MSLPEIMMENRQLEIDYYGLFKSVFRRNLHDYMNYISGFDLVRFDNMVIHSKDGESMQDAIRDSYGDIGLGIIKALIKYPEITPETATQPPQERQRD